MAQFLLTEYLGLPTLCSIISDISSTILQILVPILLQISWIFQNTPNFCNLMVLKGVMDKKPKKIRHWNICHFEPTLIFNLFWGWAFSTFFLIIWFKSTKMKFRPYYTMELVQKLMKKTSKYLIYSPLTEKVLTEWPCIRQQYSIFFFFHIK